MKRDRCNNKSIKASMAVSRGLSMLAGFKRALTILIIPLATIATTSIVHYYRSKVAIIKMV